MGRLIRLITSQIDTAPKLFSLRRISLIGLITSQIDTAPKRVDGVDRKMSSLITSQIDTAPKLQLRTMLQTASLITSQIDTAPKPGRPGASLVVSLITSQIDTAPKQDGGFYNIHVGLITSQIDTAPKLERDNGSYSSRLITSQIDTAPKRYGTAGGLCGVNCRHTMTPYVDGLSRLPDTDFAAQQRLTGMTSDEYYAATQAQRRLEARVRETKREVALGEAAGADVTAARVRLGGLQGRLRDHCRACHLRRDYERERAYGLPEGTAQPRALLSLPLEQRERSIPREQRAAGTAYDVSRRAVNGTSYRRKFDSAGLPKRAAATCYTEARRILRDRDGTDRERMSVVSWRDGRLVCNTFGARAEITHAGLTLEQYRRVASTDGGVVIMHNHPASTRPSWPDLMSVAANDFVRASLVLCHDGSVYVISGTSSQLVSEYNGIIVECETRFGGMVSNERIQMMALDVLYERNEAEKWLRIRRL